MRDDDRRLTRLARLRDLVDRLERLPKSTHREWMLDEVRARIVDVDTGFPPQPIHPLRAAKPAPAAGPSSRRPSKRPSPPPRAPRNAGAGPREAALPKRSSHPAGELTEDRAGDRCTDGTESSPGLVDIGQAAWLWDSPEATIAPPPPGLPW